MKKLLFLFLVSFGGFAQEQPFDKEEIVVSEWLKGSLYKPAHLNNKTDLVILIAGSGATDRDGNQKGLANNSLRFLAEALAKNDIAVFSYDKRIIAQMAAGKVSEKDLSFGDFIADAKTVVAHFRAKKQFRRIIIAGHSEGSLIGMVAANGNTDAFISIAGAGRTIDEVLEEQLVKQLPASKDQIHGYLQQLKKGETFEVKDPMLAMIFKPSVQPYLTSWISYNPQSEIAKLKIPVLLINGNRDIQVPVSDAELLKQAKPDAQLKIIPDMNHVFKEVKSDDMTENTSTYTNPDLPVKPDLIATVNQFIKSM